MTLANIDFGRLYREHYAAARRRRKPAEAWDERAARLSRKTQRSSYVDDFIARMDLRDADSLLDVGCGPGTICLPLAGKLKRVIGLDFSQGMLDELQANAGMQSLNNVETLRLSWEDDWSAVPACDIVVASRSTMVDDMAAALHKLNDKAQQRVYLTHLVGGGHLNAIVSEVIGRAIPTQPDYIYVVNLLHQMGLHPRLDFISHEALPGRYDGFREFARRASWALGALSEAEIARLRAWHDQERAALPPMRWAFIWWEKPQGHSESFER